MSANDYINERIIALVIDVNQAIPLTNEEKLVWIELQHKELNIIKSLITTEINKNK